MVNLSSMTKTSTQFLHLIGSTKLPLYAWYGAFLLLSGVDNCSMAAVVDTVRSTKVIKKWNVILSDLIMQSQRDIPCWKDDLFLNMTTDSLYLQLAQNYPTTRPVLKKPRRQTFSTLGDECVMLNHRPKNPETKTCILFIFQLPKGQLIVKCVRGQAIPIY